ncbi:lysylphosphatidylglycerol synthase transmembrane domain-containing protein [Sphaerisporangium sp. B11E5]|uniref:lysylphosphatidylglycerol synthase transmembrane domain-containing protein n=1 Tax=Sphaerisporangium sp. B11E5 TaxID=3153563 RepID=UPI00325E18E8
MTRLAVLHRWETPTVPAVPPAPAASVAPVLPAAPAVRTTGAWRRAWPLLRPWVRVAAGAAILGVLVARLGTGAFVNAFAVVGAPQVLAALGIGLLTTVLSVWRWSLVARRLGLALPLPTAFADYYRALFLNAVLPAGVLGDAHRAVKHGRTAGDVGRAVRAVVLERTGGQVVLIAAGFVMLAAEPSLAAAVLSGLAPGAALVAAALAVAVAAVALAAHAGGRAARALAASLADVRRGLLARDAWPGVLALSAAALAGHLTLFLVAVRAAGSAAPVGELLPLMLLALLVMALPVNVGGWGPREAFSAVAFGAVGLGAQQGLTAAVVYGLLTLIASLPGAAVLVLRRGTGGGQASRTAR